MSHERAAHPRVRAAAAHGLLEAVAAAGGSPERVLALADLRPTELSEPDRFVPLAKLAALFNEAARATGDDGLGLRVGSAYDLAALGALSYAVFHAATVGTALHNLERYIHSHLQGARVILTVAGDECRLLLEFPVIADGRQGVESAMVVVFRILCRLAGPEWTPRRVLFSHARPASSAMHERIFGAPVEFGGSADGAIVFAAADLDQPVAGADRRLLPIVEQHLDQVLEGAKDDDRWLHGIREVIARTVCDGHPVLGVVARRIGQSERTLQRRLGERGLVWKRLVEDVRRDLAVRYLENEKVPLGEVAFLLGYSEQSAFHRAFRRWTGATPLAFRRRGVGPRTDS